MIHIIIYEWTLSGQRNKQAQQITWKPYNNIALIVVESTISTPLPTPAPAELHNMDSNSYTETVTATLNVLLSWLLLLAFVGTTHTLGGGGDIGLYSVQVI